LWRGCGELRVGRARRSERSERRPRPSLKCGLGCGRKLPSCRGVARLTSEQTRRAIRYGAGSPSGGFRVVSGRYWPEISGVSNLRLLVVRWLGNIMLATRCSSASARAATSRSTTAAAVSPVDVTAVKCVARKRGPRACEARTPSTTTAIPTRGRRCIASRRQTVAHAVQQKPWGITAATRKRESYEYVHRRRPMPSRRPLMPLSSTPRRQSSKRLSCVAMAQLPNVTSGSWWRGPKCSRPRGAGWAPRPVALSADDKVASSRSFRSRSGATARCAGLAGCDV
jgi:hypothetical protein